MSTQRLEAFSDGVIAIIITIMVLELHVPHEPTFGALVATLPTLASYVLSFVYVGIYWSNHHHLLHLTPRASGGILWANLHLLFWLSLVPLATEWNDASQFAPVPSAVYGVVLLGAAGAWYVLLVFILRKNGVDGPLGRAVGKSWKVRLSPLMYAAGIGLAFVSPIISEIIYAVMAALWFVPDRRMERAIEQADAA